MARPRTMPWVPGDHLYHPSAFDPARPVPSWWEASAPPLEIACPPLEDTERCEVAVIGAGYTGLAAARRLALEYAAEVRVLDSGVPGWGASGRNGGFCCLGGTKLEFGALVHRYGLTETRRLFAVQRAAIETVQAIAAEHDIDIEACASGETLLAHRRDRLADLRAQRRALASALGIDCTLLDRDALAARGMCGPEFHAGLRIPLGFGLHPLRYARGLARAAHSAGAVIHGHSPVIDWSFADGRHRLRTPSGELSARAVVVATNGYTGERLSPLLAGRLLPAMSAILVTRPLTARELEDQGWQGHELAYDSRHLLHYFRLLPDNRFLFGGRGGTRADPAAGPGWQQSLRIDFERMFPAWRDVEDTHRWRGFVCLARARVPFVGALDAARRSWAALAWHGSGVSMGTWSGHALAALVAGARGAEAAIPRALGQPLKPFAVPRLRVAALRAAYLGCRLHDAGLPLPAP